MAENARGTPRRSWVLIRWACVVLALGVLVVVVALAVVRFAPPAPDLGSPAAVWIWVGAGGALALAGIVFLALGVFLIRLPARDLTPKQSLIVRAASAMVAADGDAAEVEVQALRRWIVRRLDFRYAFDELAVLAEANSNEAARKAVMASLVEQRRPPSGWTVRHDRALLEACKTVLVADLNVRDAEIDYLREIAKLVGEPQEKVDELVKAVADLKDQMVAYVVERLLDEEKVREGRGGDLA